MMMSDNMKNNTRREIMMKFLRTLVWIDDEIRPDKVDTSGDRFRSFFYPTAQEFQKRELLVHLHPYDADTSTDGGNTFDDNDSKSLGSAVALAKKSDVIILDWHLGREDPKNSIQLLKRLVEESAIRYIVVLSKYAEKFADEMREGGMLADNSGNSSGSKFSQGNGDTWVNSQGAHIVVRKKPEPSSFSAEEFCGSIFDVIYDLMSKANLDYLHWTAIEIAAKLRHSIPSWVQAIPCGTDAAFLSELSSDKTEARDFIVENLLEDLNHIAKLNSLSSLESANCALEHWTNKPYAIQNIATSDERCKKFVHFHLSSSKLEKKDVTSIRENQTEDEPSKIFLRSQQSLTEFCENLSSDLEPFPTFGAVYKQADSADVKSNNIYVCLSQECDALRSQSLMILKGKLDDGTTLKEGETKLSLLGNVFRFLPEAQSLQSVIVCSKGDGRCLDGFQKVSQLRKSTARRILSRFWNHMSRSAVNLSRFTLKERDGQ